MNKKAKPLNYIIIPKEADEAMSAAHDEFDAAVEEALDAERDNWTFADKDGWVFVKSEPQAPCSQCGRLTGGCCTVARTKPYPTDIEFSSEKVAEALRKVLG